MGGEGVEVVDGTSGSGSWFWDDAVEGTGCPGDAMATFHVNASLCGTSGTCFMSRIAVRATVPCKRTETSHPWR
jgi:hypothetical protein